MAFCGLTLNKIIDELHKLEEGKVSDIYIQNSNEIVFEIFKNNTYKLNINLSSKYYSIYLENSNIDSDSFTYKTSSNFLTSLKKHLLNKKIDKIYTLSLERIAFIDFIGFNDLDEIEELRLVIELMGKHSNIILLDSQNVIIDSFKHLRKDEENPKTRDIFPKIKYIQPLNSKKDFSSLSLKDFSNLEPNTTPTSFEDLKQHFVLKFANNITGISKDFINSYLDNIEQPINTNIDKLYSDFYGYILNCINNISKLHLQTKENNYTVALTHDVTPPFAFNYSLSSVINSLKTNEYIQNVKTNLIKNTNSLINKYERRLLNIKIRLKDSASKGIFKLYGELITSNIYRLDPNAKQRDVTVWNYYIEKELVIMLDRRKTILQNANFFYKKYNKLKNQEAIVLEQKEETIQILDYLQTIMFEIENIETKQDIENINYELESLKSIGVNVNNGNLQGKKDKRNKKAQTKGKQKTNFNPLKFEIDNHVILVGKNNLENDYLTLKYANDYDIWFHTKDFHGTHVILRLNYPNEEISEELLVQAACLAKEHSKAKNSSNVPVDYTKVKFVKKPKNSNPGLVIYTHQKTIYV